MRLLKACSSFCFFLLPLTSAFGGDGDTKFSDEEISIVSMLDSLAGSLFAERFQLALTAEDTSSVPIENLPRFSDSVVLNNILKIQSEIPLAFNDRVKRYIEVYSIERHAKVEIMLGLSEIYFPIFEEALDRRNMPHHLKYLPVVESALNANAVSRAGATGLWQLMYSTGRMLGLTINSYLDERRDPYKSTEAALDYLQKMYGVYGDWLLVIAAYNCGPGNVNKAIARARGERNFWKIQHYLPAETRGYVPAFLAAMYVFMHYKDFQLNPVKPQFSSYPADTVMLYRAIGLSHIAQQLNIPNEELLFLNPALKKRMVPVSSNGYALKLPVNKVAQFVALKDSIFRNMPNPELELLEQSKITAQYEKITPSGSKVKLYYTVKTGDNLGYIADWYDCTPQQIRNWNGMYGSTIRTGQKLVIYVPKDLHASYLDVNSMSFREKQEWKAAGGASAITKRDDSCNCIYYKVRTGDTLWEISQKYRVSVDDIKRHNNVSENTLKPGMVLKIMI
ncbi:MAG TPA: transglycosylase SLT domain-containing protein [Chitinophagales bacterium]|nr:transglycosylase SLT domain-containing protein [Chitinophagales bacterium]